MEIHITPKSVQIYRSGALITENTEIQAAAGYSSVRMAVYGCDLHNPSVRLQTSGNVQCRNVQVRAQTKEEKDERVKDIRRQMNSMESALEVKRKVRELWLVNADFTKKDTRDTEEIRSYLDSLSDRLCVLDTEIAKLQEEYDEMQKKLEDMEEMNSCPVVTADLYAEEDCTAVMDITYFTNKAGWNPVYEIYADDEQETLEIRMKAMIRQFTGKDWKDVKMTLSTGNASGSQSIPVLTPMRARFHTSPAYRLRANTAMAKSSPIEVLEDSAADRSEEMAESIFETAESVKDRYMMQYTLTGNPEVKGNGTVCHADLTRKQIPVTYQVNAVPKLDDHVYLAAAAKVSDIEDILEAETAIYIKGVYQGTAVINPEPDKDPFIISLGRIENIQVQRNTKKNFTSENLLKTQKKTEYTYEITVSSVSEEISSVQIQDQVPVSSDKSIIITVNDISEGRMNEETGIITWEFTLKPHEIRKFTVSYTVQWPQNKRAENIY